MNALMQSIAISIPYGSIKAKVKADGMDSRIEFQFLMVRLKLMPFRIMYPRFSHFNSLWFD